MFLSGKPEGWPKHREVHDCPDGLTLQFWENADLLGR